VNFTGYQSAYCFLILCEHSSDIRGCQAKPKPPTHFKTVAEALVKKQNEARVKNEPGPSSPKAKQKKEEAQDPLKLLHKVEKLVLINDSTKKMKPTNSNAHTYVEDNDVKVSIMRGDENVNAQTYRRTVEQRHCSGSVFSPRQQHWRRNAVARGKQRLPRHASHARRTYHT